MRKLVWFTLGFAAGIALSVWLLGPWWLPLLGILLLPVGLCLGMLRSPGMKRRIFSCILVGICLSTVWFALFDFVFVGTPRSYDKQTASLTVHISDYPSHTDTSVTADGIVKLRGRWCKVRVYLAEDVHLQPGDRIKGEFTLYYKGYDSERQSRSLQGSGQFLTAYPKGALRHLRPEKMPIQYYPAIWRQRILDKLDHIFPEDTSGFARALLLGDTQQLSMDDDTAMQISGIRHIVAVSGLHVSIAISLMVLLCGRNRFLLALIGLPFMLLFASLAGFTHSVMRACLMHGLMILAMLLRKEYDPPSSLAFAVLVILGINPLSLTTVGFQLSVGCCVGIFLFSSRIYSYFYTRSKPGSLKGKGIKARTLRWLYRCVSVTLGAMSLTTPLSAYHFGMISTVGMFTNLLTIWIVSYLFYGIALSAALGFLWTGLGALPAWIVSWPIRYVLRIAKAMAALPYSSVSAHNLYIMIWIVFVYVLVFALIVSKKKHPILSTACILAGFVGALTLSALEVRLDPYRMTVLDVGQGQCVLLQSKQDCFVVDCGGDFSSETANEAVSRLKTQGVFRVDGLILTHYDYDHAGGAEQFMTLMPTDRLFVPDDPSQSVIKTKLTERFADKMYLVCQPIRTSCGLGNISIFPADKADAGNESSLCILFQTKNCDILITGDRDIRGERELLEHYRIPKLEVLVAGHHGAQTSSGLYLLEETRPEYVIISVGKNNRYGHPEPETLKRFAYIGCKILRTDLHGTIIIRG